MRMMALCMALAVSTALSTGAIAVAELPAAEQAAVFKAAGFTRHGAQWRSDCDDPGTPSYSPGQIDQVRDINGDGRLEVVITEGGTYCYGMTGSAFWIVSQQADGRWRLITSSIGIPAFLATRGRAAGPISRSADRASASRSSAGTVRPMCSIATSTRESAAGFRVESSRPGSRSSVGQVGR